jgi:hypothetical protein
MREVYGVVYRIQYTDGENSRKELGSGIRQQMANLENTLSRKGVKGMSSKQQINDHPGMR